MKFNLKITFFLFAILAAGILTSSAQNTAPSAFQGQLSGITIDSKTSQPVDFATVSLFKSAAKQPFKVSQTDLNGKFLITGIPAGTYLVKISFLGYQPYSSDSLSISNGLRDLGTIKLLAGKSTVLQEVVVQGQRSTIQLGIDRKVFSVNQSLVSEGGSATDLLANVPSVSVDMDGNVSLRGADNVRILIDGKPSAIGGGNIAQLLQSLPANSIENIELVTNPSSKYDPEGQSGIINIVLKKNKKIGLNGSLTASAGTYDNYNAGTNLSYRDGKINLYGNYNFRNGNRLGSGFNNTTFISGNGLVNNISDNTRNNISHSIKAGFDYYLDPKTTAGLSGNLSLRDNRSRDNLNYLFQNLPSQNGSSSRISKQDGTSSGYDLSLDINRQLKKKGESLIANFAFGQEDESDVQNFDQNFFNPDGSQKDTLDRRINNNGEFNQNYNIQLDYTLPINEKQKFEAGFRTSIRQTEESQFSKVYSRINNDFNTDYNLSSDFNLNDQVYALYSSYQNQLTDKFGIQGGLRAEQAYLKTQYSGLASSPDFNTYKGNLDYFRLYPSIFLSYKLSKQQQLQLSYTRRVNRPRGWQVNPFPDVSDQNNIRVGNPNLRPEDINSFELSYINYWKTLTLTSSAYLRQVNDVVQGIRQPLPNTNGATITQFFNFGTSRSSGLELIAKADLAKNASLTSNVNLFYSQIQGNPQFNIKGRNGFNWNASMTGNFQLAKNLSSQFNFNYMAPRVAAQGRNKEMYGMDAGLRMDVLKNRAGSISFNVRDIFNSRRFGQLTETAFILQESERRMQGRMATLTLSYRFGKQDFGSRRKNNDKDQEQRSEEELF